MKFVFYQVYKESFERVLGYQIVYEHIIKDQ